MRSGIRKPAFRQNIRPEIGDDVEKAERDLPPVGKVFRSNSSKLAPFSPISFDLIHQPCQIAGEPDRIGSRCRNGNVVNTEKGAHMRRQRFPPRTDQSRQKQKPLRCTDRWIDIEDARRACIEESCIFIHIAERLYCRQNSALFLRRISGRNTGSRFFWKFFSRIHIDQNGPQCARCATRGHIDGGIGQCQRIGWITGETFDQPPFQKRLGKGGQKGRAGRN